MTGPGNMAAASRTARASCASWSPAVRAAAPGLDIGVRLSAFDCMPFKPGGRRRTIGVQRIARRMCRVSAATYPLCLRRRWHRHRHRPGEPTVVPRSAGEAGHPAGLHHRRQPVLQPAHPAAGALPALRRLSAAGRSAGRRGAADRSSGGAQSASSRPGVRRLGLLLSCRSGCPTWRRPSCATGWIDFVGIGPHGAVAIPTCVADVLAGTDAAAQAHLPHLQRLHHRRRATAWCPAAIRWMTSTSHIRSVPCLIRPRANKPARST